jgi:hypothetical protein
MVGIRSSRLSKSESVRLGPAELRPPPGRAASWCAAVLMTQIQSTPAALCAPLICLASLVSSIRHVVSFRHCIKESMRLGALLQCSSLLKLDSGVLSGSCFLFGKGEAAVKASTPNTTSH